MRCPPLTLSAVSVASMPYNNDVDDPGDVLDRVHHSVVADANAPEVFRASYLPTPRGSRIICEALNRRENPKSERALEPLQVLAS